MAQQKARPRPRSATPGGAVPRPAADHGFFGPESPAWQVWSHPSSVLWGFARAVAVEFLDPHLAAAVDSAGRVREHTRLRYDRTVEYFATVVFGDARSALAASDALMDVHARAVGTDPVTRTRFDANDPGSQLWIHVTAWHSLLYCYEVLGPGPLSPEDEARYWQDCVTAARLQPIDLADVPRSRAEVREYYARRRPRLAASEVAQEYFGLMTRLADVALLAGVLPRPVRRAVDAVTRRAIVATFPQWIRRLAGVRQGRLADVVTTTLSRALIRAVHTSPRLEVELLRRIAPRASRVLDPVLLGIPPVDPRVWTIDEARAEFGHPESPPERHRASAGAR